MKILVFSDSHRSVGRMLDAVEKEKPQQIIHLGDIMDDAEEVSYAYPMLPVAMVPGNCDGWTMVPPEKCITLAGKTVLMGHGHTWGVKSGYGAAITRARAMNADLLLFGHTHRAYCEQLEDGLWVMNPGAARATYGVVNIDDGVIRCQLKQMD